MTENTHETAALDFRDPETIRSLMAEVAAQFSSARLGPDALAGLSQDLPAAWVTALNVGAGLIGSVRAQTPQTVLDQQLSAVARVEAVLDGDDDYERRALLEPRSLVEANMQIEALATLASSLLRHIASGREAELLAPFRAKLIAGADGERS